jgi:hypothetical protein
VDAEPARHPAEAPCLYAVDDAWYADCVDGRRLRILRMAIDQRNVAPQAAPAALSKQPLALT